MKTLYSLLLCTVSLACTTAQAQDTVHLRGELVDMGKDVVVMRYVGAASQVGDSRNVSIQLDRDGRFDLVMPLDEPAYFDISRNTLYLSPGDDMTVRITQNNEEATFEGRGAEACNYLRHRLFPKGGSFLEGGGNMRPDIPALRNMVDSMANLRYQELENLTEVSEQFKQQERARITADKITSYFYYPNYYGWTYKGLTREALTEKFSNYAEEITPIVLPLIQQVNKDELLDVAVVRNVLNTLTDKKYEAWNQQSPLSQRATEMFAAARWSRQLNDGAVENVQELEAFVTGMKHEDFRKELKLKQEKTSLLASGRPAFDLRLADRDGNSHLLSELKGQILYIDLWATWCGPCMQEAPHFEKLAQEFAGRGIRFVSLSTDTNRKAWLAEIKKRGNETLEFNCVDEALQNNWKLNGIPRFLLIDKDFNIINAFAPRPSQPETKALLEELLKR